MDKPAPMHIRIARGLADTLRQSLRTCFDLFKIILPVILVIRLLELAGCVDWLGRALGPVMELVGLPGKTGLVWATAMLTNLYAGAAVLVNLDLPTPLSAAQATVLTTMMLIAHNLPVELRIAQKAGTRLRVMALLRIAGALLAGFILYRVYDAAGWLEGPSTAIFIGRVDAAWGAWIIGQGIFLLNSDYSPTLTFFPVRRAVPSRRYRCRININRRNGRYAQWVKHMDVCSPPRLTSPSRSVKPIPASPPTPGPSSSARPITAWG
jgi:spore maturation protein SpmB